MDGDFSYDGERSLLRYQDWYEEPQPDGYGSKQNPGAHMSLWDGRVFWSYAGRTIPLPNLPRGRVIMTQNVRSCPQFSSHMFPNPQFNFTIGGYSGHPLMGFLLEDLTGDHRRLDEIVAGANSVSLRSAAESVGGAACCVVDAELPAGVLSVWLDPNRQYNVAQAVFEFSPGYASPDWPELEFSHGRMVYRTLQYAEISGLWVPMEAVWEKDFQYTRGDYSRNRCTLRRLLFELNPDFQGRNTFSMPALEEGTIVYHSECSVNPNSGEHVDRMDKEYVWHNGRLVLITR